MSSLSNHFRIRSFMKAMTFDIKKKKKKNTPLSLIIPTEKRSDIVKNQVI